MDIICSIIAGIIQGVTEFLPISSSGHLVLFHQLVEFEVLNDLLFDVVLHLGTLISLLIYFRKDIGKYIIAFFQSFAKWQLRDNLDQRLAWFIVIGTIPAVVLGYFLDNIFENFFRQTYWVAIMLILVAILFYVLEKIAPKNKDFSALNVKNTLMIGLAQAIALIPGVSRSGITILAGMGSGLTRQMAARFSFLLSIPVVLGAGLKKSLEMTSYSLDAATTGVLVAGFLASAIAGYVCIKYFLRYLQKNTLKPFAIYRIFLALVVFGYFYIFR
ncbi:MAG: undecaprenyl-diphosphatase UppP [Patescibacteria group bacterium]